MLALGLQDGPQLPVADLAAQAHALHAQWTRIITTTGDDAAAVADRIRAAKSAGLRVVLTVGGLGTVERRPGVRATLRWVARLPRADAYTWTNEPDINGTNPVVYRRGWRRLRRVLGRALWWCDCSPHAPHTFSIAAGGVPTRVTFAIHPYQLDDPLTRTQFAPWAEGALGNLPRRAWAGGRWAITEVGQTPDRSDAWWWPRAIKRAHQLRATVMMIYTACGPSWCTRPSDAAWKAINDSTT